MKLFPWERFVVSHPTRGEWIEINLLIPTSTDKLCLTPHGVSGLKYRIRLLYNLTLCLTPHGVSGLKCNATGCFVYPLSLTPCGVKQLCVVGRVNLKVIIINLTKGSWQV